MFQVMAGGKLITDARRRIGISQEELARRIGISQAAIKKIEDGTTKQSKYLPAIAQELGIELSQLDPSLKKNLRQFPDRSRPYVQKWPVPGRPKVSRRGLPQGNELFADRDLPVYGIAMGGKGALVLSADAFMVIHRPTHLVDVVDAFGVMVVGDSMAREYREGDVAYVNPHLPPRVGDACLFQSDVNGEVQACIKYLEKPAEASSEVWHVSQANPEKTFTLEKAIWQRCFVLVGKQTGR